ncbi:YraN family protein [Candidatus Kaiserbacteria bacterium]|nr:YraN family protein [Candidatus Kaiserbacteria bacterium]
MEKFSKRRRLGNVGEEIACEFLIRKGFKLLERNYLRPWGEIDIIAFGVGIVRFIEVKSVSGHLSKDFSREKSYLPEEMVHVKKLKKLARTATLYMEEKKDPRPYQIDVIGVIIDAEKRAARCRFFEQVLDDII